MWNIKPLPHSNLHSITTSLEIPYPKIWASFSTYLPANLSYKRQLMANTNKYHCQSLIASVLASHSCMKRHKEVFLFFLPPLWMDTAVTPADIYLKCCKYTLNQVNLAISQNLQVLLYTLSLLQGTEKLQMSVFLKSEWSYSMHLDYLSLSIINRRTRYIQKREEKRWVVFN